MRCAEPRGLQPCARAGGREPDTPDRSLSTLSDLRAGADTAGVCHDHEYEPAILQRMLATPAFYIGAQGSRAIQTARLAQLKANGVSTDELARLRGPIGLIPSSRDPKSLAISVLSEVVGEHGASNLKGNCFQKRS